jgi:DNA polymerase-3 subunit delta'
MWQGIIGHDDVVDRFRRSIQAGRLASTYLFTGSPGIGKKRFALELAHTLLCANEVDADLQPCGRCESCRMFVAGNHPDLEVVGLPPDKTTLPIELFIGDREHRNQEGLCHRLGLRPFFGRRKVAIVDDADHFGIASANCLLKTLEEPPPSAMLILIGTSPSRQLPTIRSRSQIVRFRTLPMEDVATILIGTGATSDRDFAVQIAQLSDGSIERAMQLTDTTLWEFRDRLYAALQIARLDSVRLTRLVQPFVDEAGKETSQRRERLRIVIGFVIERHQQLLRSSAASEACRATQALDACLSALEQIDRNANLGLVIQNWCEGLAGGTIRNAVGPLAFASAPH